MKRQHNKTIIILVSIVIMIMLSAHCFSLGVSPGKKTYEYIPSSQHHGTIKIYNPDNEKTTIKIDSTGDLKDSLIFDTQSIDIEKENYITEINYTFTIPKIIIPGIHVAKIVVSSSEKTSNAGILSITPTISLNSRIEVNVPYPGKYIVSELIIPTIKTGDNTFAYIKIENKGKNNISKIYAKIDIKEKSTNDTNSKTIVTKTTDKEKLKLSERKEIIDDLGIFDTGDYTAYATIFYDNNSINLKKDFSVGLFFVGIKDIRTNFNAKGITEIDLIIRNNANRKTTNTSIRLDFDDISSMSLKKDIDTHDEKEFRLFFKTPKQGNYTGTLTLVYENQKKQEKIDIEITDRGMFFDGVTGKIIVEPKNIKQQTDLSIIFLLVAIIVLAGTYVVINYRKKINKNN